MKMLQTFLGLHASTYMLSLFLMQSALCGQFPIPSTWSQMTFNASQNQRLQIAQDALGVLQTFVNVSTGSIADFSVEPTANLQWVIILQDLLGNSTANEAQVINNFQAFEQEDVNFNSGQPGLSSDALFWGVAAYYAYRAYNNPIFLNWATMIWNEMAVYVVTLEQASAGNSSARNITFQSACDGASTAGAVFLESAISSDLQIYGHVDGLFLTLSAYLFEQTQNSTYRMYAELVTAFIQNNLYNGQVILYSYDIGSCTATLPSSALYTYSTGLVTEGWTVLANATNNATLKAEVDNLIYSSVMSATWTNTEGINFEEPSADLDNYYNGFKGYFIRGLHTAWQQNDPSSEIAQFIAAYIAVQFNALQRQVAQAPQPNIYSSKWFGGPPSSFQPYSQVIALHTLNAAFSLPDNTTSSTNATSGIGDANPGHNESSDSRPNVGVIVGSVIGVIVGLGLLCSLVLILWRRRRRALRLVLEPEIAARTAQRGGEIEPFVYLPSTRISTSQRYPREKGPGAQTAQYVSPPFDETDPTETPARSSDFGRRNHERGSGSDIEQSIAPVARVEPASAAELQRLSETVNVLISSLAVQNTHHVSHEGELPPVYESRDSS